jgi:hypothetical protein
MRLQLNYCNTLLQLKSLNRSVTYKQQRISFLLHRVQQHATNYKYVILRPPLYFSGQSSQQQTRSLGFDSQCHYILCVAVGLDRDPLSLVNISEELLERIVAALV